VGAIGNHHHAQFAVRVESHIRSIVGPENWTTCEMKLMMVS
jgi:hypothetical protein